MPGMTLRCPASVATVLGDPSLKFRPRVQAELSRVDALQVWLDVALEMAQAHAERFSGLPSRIGEARNVVEPSHIHVSGSAE
jgi:hypothetical protein